MKVWYVYIEYDDCYKIFQIFDILLIFLDQLNFINDLLLI